MRRRGIRGVNERKFDQAENGGARLGYFRTYLHMLAWRQQPLYSASGLHVQNWEGRASGRGSRTSPKLGHRVRGPVETMSTFSRNFRRSETNTREKCLEFYKRETRSREGRKHCPIHQTKKNKRFSDEKRPGIICDDLRFIYKTAVVL